MRQAGVVVADVLSELQRIAAPGVTTAHLDGVALQMTAEAGAEALFKGVRSPQARRPFPGAICASVNDEVVHGIPSEQTVAEGGRHPEHRLRRPAQRLLRRRRRDGADRARSPRPIGGWSTRPGRCSEIAIAMARPGVRWSQVAAKMQNRAESAGFSRGAGFCRARHRHPDARGSEGPELRQRGTAGG